MLTSDIIQKIIRLVIATRIIFKSIFIEWWNTAMAIPISWLNTPMDSAVSLIQSSSAISPSQIIPNHPPLRFRKLLRTALRADTFDKIIKQMAIHLHNQAV